MEYLVVSARFNDDKNADATFATDDKDEAIEAAKDGGSGTVVVRVDETGNKTVVFTAPYKKELSLPE